MMRPLVLIAVLAAIASLASTIYAYLRYRHELVAEDGPMSGTLGEQAGSTLAIDEEVQRDVKRSTNGFRAYPSFEAAEADVVGALSNLVQDVQIISVSMREFLNSDRSPLHHAWSILEEYILARRSIADSMEMRIRILLPDPYSVSARLLGGAGHNNGNPERLKADILLAADRLLYLQQARRNPDVAFQFRFYRSVTHSFLLSINRASYVRPFMLDGRTGRQLGPILVFENDSPVSTEIHSEFDTIWSTVSISPREVISASSKGVDEGISVSGIANIYTDIGEARERILSLVARASSRIFVQGISLEPMWEESSLYYGMAQAVAKNADVKVLLLDPNSEQAYYESFVDHAWRTSTNGDLAMSWKEYRADGRAHHNSSLYADIERSIRLVANLSRYDTSERLELRLYSSAPTAFLAIVDDHVLVQQDHYGGRPIRPGIDSTLPIIEYERPISRLFPPLESSSPLSIWEDHFRLAFDAFGYPPASVVG
jgi:hypothetical protein